MRAGALLLVAALAGPPGGADPAVDPGGCSDRRAAVEIVVGCPAPVAAAATGVGRLTVVPLARPAADPPRPPPLTVGPPTGARPGPAPGLHSPERCTPPPADVPGPNAGAAAQRLRLADAHRLATGAGQLIAVIDTGVAPEARFGDRLAGGGDYLTGGDGRTDCDGHGTAVAGLLAAAPAGRDGGGVTGTAPGARLLAIRQSSPSFEVAGFDGTSRPAGDVRTLAEAIALAVRSGATVVNISEAVCLPAARAAGQGALVQAALRAAAAAGVVVVAAAGNADVGGCAPAGQEPADQVALPGWYGDDVLTVGAVGPDDAAAPFSVPGRWVDVAAPGTDLRSLAVGGGTTGVGVAGTSFAAPWVAGLAALVRERFPQLTAAQVGDRILATARRPAAGQAGTLGHGVIDPVAALTAVPDVLPAAAVGGPAGRATAVLAGTEPHAPIGAPAPVAPAATVLLGACTAAVWMLRRPRRRSRQPR